MGTEDLEIEREHDATERLAQAHAALAAAQDRSYWLDRWQVDLNALMRRRGADQVRTGIRVARTLRRHLVLSKRQASELAEGLRTARTKDNADEAAPLVEEVVRAAPFSRSLSPRGLAAAPVTDLMFDRLTEADVAAVEALLEPEERALLAHAGESDRRRLLLSYGVHHGAAGVIDRTGLLPAAPPANVHAMGRGAAAAGGTAYYADIVVDGLRTSGFELADGMRVLDFGCSSARVVRVFAAAYPDIDWAACDPIVDAIAWATEHLPAIEFIQSPEHPPLPYADESLDVAYAISIWSHFAEPAALAWLDEMHRLVKPGGRLVLTTHGFQTLAHDAGGVRGPAQLSEVRKALYADGFWFKDEFGSDRDHGVGDAQWGTAFLTTEWLAWQAAPRWNLAAFAPGRVENNQDLYVLERR